MAKQHYFNFNKFKIWPVRKIVEIKARIIKKLCYLRANKRLHIRWFELLLCHGVVILSTVTCTLMPIFNNNIFEKNKYKYLIFGISDGDLILNLYAIIYCASVVLFSISYILTNIKFRFGLNKKNLFNMLKQSADLHYKYGIFSTTAIVKARYEKDNNIDNPIKQLKQTLTYQLGQTNKLISAFLDTVEKNDIITSNIMVSLANEKIPGKRKLAKDLSKIKANYIYKSDVPSDSECECWLQVIAECQNSRQFLNLSGRSMYVHKDPTKAIFGAPEAWHLGCIMNDSDPGEECRYSVVNDVEAIGWPESSSEDIKLEAKQYFKKAKHIKSFVSIPLIRADEVVGVLNINSSNYFLFGPSKEQNIIFDTLVVPSLASIADTLHLWREYKYATK